MSFLLMSSSLFTFVFMRLSFHLVSLFFYFAGSFNSSSVHVISGINHHSFQPPGKSKKTMQNAEQNNPNKFCTHPETATIHASGHSNFSNRIDDVHELFCFFGLCVCNRTD